jgi:hypothetical protein
LKANVLSGSAGAAVWAMAPAAALNINATKIGETIFFMGTPGQN